jgi:RNA polymerase sigma-70 factor (sigma-E family)
VADVASVEFDEYVAASWPRLVRAAMLLGCTYDEAEDTVQSALTRCLVKWSKVRRADDRDAYVHRILVNTWQDEARKAARRGSPYGLDDQRPAPAEPDVVERLTQLELLRRLPPRQRAAVVLRFYDDLSIQETAAALGCSEGTIKSLSSRGLRALRGLADQTEGQL